MAKNDEIVEYHESYSSSESDESESKNNDSKFSNSEGDNQCDNQCADENFSKFQMNFSRKYFTGN